MVSFGLLLPFSVEKTVLTRYPPLVDPRLSGAQVQNLYWGSLYSRLQSIKKKYDPKNVLRNPQSISLN